VGDVAQSKKRALLEELGEYTSPDAIQARMNSLKLSGAQSGAALPLVGPQAEATKIQLARQKWNSVYNGGVDAYQQFGPMFGHTGEAPLPDGTPNFEAMGKIGQQLMVPAYRMQLAQQSLVPDASQTTEGVTSDGKKTKIVRNKYGVNITPGSPELDRLLREAYPFGLPASGIIPTSGAPPPPQRAVSAGESSAPLVTPIGTSATAPGAEPSITDVVNPDTSSAVGSYDPTTGGTITSEPQMKLPFKEAREELSKNPGYATWSNTLPEYEKFKGLESQGQSALNDRLLAAQVVKLIATQGGAAPGLRGEQQKWEEFVGTQPVLESLKNLPDRLLKNKALNPGEREKLVNVANSAQAATERSAYPALEGAIKSFAGKPEQLLTMPQEQDLLDRGRAGKLQTAGEAVREGAATAKPNPARKTVKAGEVKAGQAVLINGVKHISNGNGTFTAAPTQ
jgi:hypothetical protein